MGALSVCFPKSNPNPLAPAWLFPSELLSEAPDGYRDEFAMYTVTQVLTPAQTITATLDTDSAGQCNFYWRGLGVFLFAGAGVPAVRMRDSDGHMMMDSRIALANGSPFGQTDAITPVVPAHRMMPTARLTFDFQETGGAAGVTVVLYIQGMKRWKQDAAFDGRGGAMGAQLPTVVGAIQ